MPAEGLERFVAAQDGTYDAALAELRRGHKTGHWMWWVFPQVAGLGRSGTARRYAIRDLTEASAYLAHPVLGPRLIEAAETILIHAGTPPEAILGGIDALKLRSSMTLFSHVEGAAPVFGEVLRAFYGGEEDPQTTVRIGSR